MIHNLSDSSSVFQHFIAEIRDKNVQKDTMRFRRNLERIGEILGYELSKTLAYENQEVITPLGVSNAMLLKQQPVIASILRAGLPMHNGILSIFDKAENAYISAYRRHHKNGDFDIHVEYLASPNIDGKTLILCDPMMATGSSMALVYKSILEKGTPEKVHILTAIASQEGLDFVKSHLPHNTDFWIGAIDEELTVQSYIVPGLGDAGDLAFGSKE